MNAPNPPLHVSAGGVLIAGAGIAGLTTAIALGRHGIRARLLERSLLGDETGAGIQLGPNATRRLRELGCLEAVEAVADRPEALWIFDGMSGRRLAAVPLGKTIEARYGAPYLTLHRADLHAALLAACREAGSAEIETQAAVGTIEERDTGIAVRLEDGREIEGSCLIGADGLWSRTRAHIAPDATPRFCGATAARAALQLNDLPAPFDASIVGLWLGPNGHVVHYPVRRGAALNVVAVTEGGDARQGWDAATESATLSGRFTKWAQPLRELVDRVPAWRTWSLYDLASLAQWSRERVVLIGDAAHPVLPFMAQGGSLAIEDAVALSEMLATHEPRDAFASFQSMREARVGQVQQASRRLGRLYHLRAPLRYGRDLVLKLRSPERLLGGLDWLYRS